MKFYKSERRDEGKNVNKIRRQQQQKQHNVRTERRRLYDDEGEKKTFGATFSMMMKIFPAQNNRIE